MAWTVGTVKKMQSYSTPPEYRRTKPSQTAEAVRVRRHRRSRSGGERASGGAAQAVAHGASATSSGCATSDGFTGGYDQPDRRENSRWQGIPLPSHGDGYDSGMRHIPSTDRAHVLLLPEAIGGYAWSGITRCPLTWRASWMRFAGLAATGVERDRPGGSAAGHPRVHTGVTRLPTPAGAGCRARAAMPSRLSRRQSGGEPTVDHECRPGDPAGLIGGKIEERGRDLGGLARCGPRDERH